MVLITGGQKSGKSKFAESLILSRSILKKPVYLATAKLSDDEMTQRVELHKKQRGEFFTTIESPLYISENINEGDWVLLECLTLWLSQIYEEMEFDFDKSFAFVKEEMMRLRSKTENLVVVTNEIGSGLHPLKESLRRYVDLQGAVNQWFGSESKEVFLIISGCSLQIKP